MKRKYLIIITIIALAIAQYLIWFSTPIEKNSGILQKSFYIHLPFAWWSFISFFVCFIASILYLIKRKKNYDILAGAAAEVGVVLISLTLLTGMLWGRAAWNTWWTWDPRLTTTLILWFLYIGYLILRTAPMGKDRRATVSAGLGIIAFLDVPLVFFSVRLWRSGHPVVIAAKNGDSGMTAAMWQTVGVSVLSFAFLWVLLLTWRYSISKRREELEAKLIMQ